MKLTGSTSLEELIEIGASVDVSGWDFSWLDGSATEERPPWGYAGRLGKRLATATASFDIQPGGGEVLAKAPHRCHLSDLFPRGSFAPTISE